MLSTCTARMTWRAGAKLDYPKQVSLARLGLANAVEGIRMLSTHAVAMSKRKVRNWTTRMKRIVMLFCHSETPSVILRVKPEESHTMKAFPLFIFSSFALIRRNQKKKKQNQKRRKYGLSLIHTSSFLNFYLKKNSRAFVIKSLFNK